MEFSRRRLLQIGLISAIPVKGKASPPPARRDSPSVIQGATDETKTQFSIVHDTSRPLTVSTRNAAGLSWSADRVDLLTLPGQRKAITRAYFSGLRLGETFTLSIADAATGAEIDARRFRALDTAAPGLKFAICSCMDDERHSPDIWRDLASQRPDFIIFAGDSVYCDKGGGGDSGEARLWRRHAEARATLEVYFASELIPIFATWDDHDFAENDAGSQFGHVKEAQATFTRFFPMEASHCSALERGPGVSSRVRLGGQQFILMDDRSWRIAGHSTARYAHWGQAQEEWMMANLESFAGMMWIVNGSQMFPEMIFKQSFSGDHPVQFGAFVSNLKRLGRRVALISGDVHFSEISEIESEKFGFRTYELTSSSIHSFKMPGLPGLAPNDRRIESTGEHNYLLVDSVSVGAGCRFRVESRSRGNRVNFRRDLEV